MATEKQYNAVPPVLLTANGTTEGVLQVVDTAGFYIQMQATLANNLGHTLTVYVKKVLSPTIMWVGATKGGMDHNVDVSAFTTATASTISAAEQNKQTVPMEARLLSTYENDPVDAWRVIQTDQYGNHYTAENPFPATFTGSISIGEVEITGPSGNLLDPNVDGSVKTVQLFTKPFDAITATYPAATQEVYQTRTGGISGTVQQTLTINYTDSTKAEILNVAVV